MNATEDMTYEQGREDMLSDVIWTLHQQWKSSWCGLNYETCTDLDHACGHRAAEVKALRALL